MTRGNAVALSVIAGIMALALGPVVIGWLAALLAARPVDHRD